MVIELNKDIDRYQESVIMGLTIKQLLFSAVSLTAGACMVLILQKYMGLTAAAYVAVPVVAPFAMQGFYSNNGMSFMEVIKRRFLFAFLNRPLTYVSEECEATVRNFQMERAIGKKKQKQRKKKEGEYAVTIR